MTLNKLTLWTGKCRCDVVDRKTCKLCHGRGLIDVPVDKSATLEDQRRQAAESIARLKRTSKP